MSKDHTGDFIKVVKPFTRETIDMAMWLRGLAWDWCPDANELIYDNYNAVAIGWSLTDRQTHVICSIAIYRTNQNIHFGFYWGSSLSDPDKLLLGKGTQYRYVLVKDKETFPKGYITKLVYEAHVVALSKIKDPRQVTHGKTILKMVSAKKR